MLATPCVHSNQIMLVFQPSFKSNCWLSTLGSGLTTSLVLEREKNNMVEFTVRLWWFLQH
jgi:hypothetical protein